MLRKGLSVRPKDLHHLQGLCMQPFAFDRQLLVTAVQRTLLMARQFTARHKPIDPMVTGLPCCATSVRDEDCDGQQRMATPPSSASTIASSDGAISPRNLTPESRSARLLNLTFGPGDDVAELVLYRIRSAKRSLVLLAFWLSYAPIVQAIIDAHRRGVDTLVLLDRRSGTKPLDGVAGHSSSSSSSSSLGRAIALLREGGVSTMVTQPPRGEAAGTHSKPGHGEKSIFHHKLMVIDNHVTCLGSSNFYELALATFDESYLCIENAPVAAAVGAFARRRQESGSWPRSSPHSACAGPHTLPLAESSLPRDTAGTRQAPLASPPAQAGAPPPLTVSGVGVSVEVVGGPFFGPECHLDTILLACVRMARRRVRLIHWRVFHRPLVQQLVHAARRGVNVSLFLDQVAPLRGEGGLSLEDENLMHLHEFQPGNQGGGGHATSSLPSTRMFHHKAILVDDDLVALGSANAFPASLREGSEDLLVLRSAEIVRRFDQHIEAHPRLRRARPRASVA